MSPGRTSASTGKRLVSYRGLLQPSSDRCRPNSTSQTTANFLLCSVWEPSGYVPNLWDRFLDAVDEEAKIVYMYGGSPHTQKEWSSALWACDLKTRTWINLSNALVQRVGMINTRIVKPLPSITEPGNMLFFEYADSKYLVIVGGTVRGLDEPGSSLRLTVINLTSRTWGYDCIQGPKAPTARRACHAALIKDGPFSLPRLFIFGGKHVTTDKYLHNYCSVVFDPTSHGWRWDVVTRKLPAAVPRMHSSTAIIAVREGKSILITRGWPIKGSNKHDFGERSLVEYLVDSGQFLVRTSVQGDFPTNFDVLSSSAASNVFGPSAFLTSIAELSADNPNPLPEIYQYSWDKDGSATITCLNVRKALQQHADFATWQIHAVYYFSGKCVAIGSQSAIQANRTRWNLALTCSLM